MDSRGDDVRRRVRRFVYGRMPRPREAYHQTVEAERGGDGAILDIGCGYAAPDLQAVGGGRRVGVDVVAFPEPYPAGIELHQADCCQLPFPDESFPLVMCRSVLEHLARPELAFAEIARVLSPGGKFVFLTPNRWDYVSLASTVIPNAWHPRLVRWLTGRSEEDTFPTFYRANSTPRLRKLARQAGLEVVQLQLLREHPHYLQFSTLTYLLGVGFEVTAQRWFPQIRPWILGVLRKPCSAMATASPLPATVSASASRQP